MNKEKDLAIRLLREEGFRITRQRKILIDIILSGTCSCCKEVYVLASKKDPGIGIATVYRTMDALEKVGALKRKTAYRLPENDSQRCRSCLVELEDHSVVRLDYSSIERMIEQKIGKKIKGITLEINKEL